MSEQIGKGTARGKDLVERAEAIKGKESILAMQKAQAKVTKDDLTALYKSAANAGYSIKTLRKAVKELMLDDEERADLYAGEQETQMELDLYRHALGLDGEADDGDEATPSGGANAAERIFNAMTESEKQEASIRVTHLGESPVVAIANAIDKRGKKPAEASA